MVMSGMPMPGGWTMSMTWMRMPGQSWIDAAAVFVGMWITMMVPMMLPSLIPMLSRYRRALATTDTTRKINTVQLGKLIALAGAGYFFAWTFVSIAIFPVGATFAALAMQIPVLARSVPIAVAIIVVLAGAFQFTARKTHYLACCREAPKCVDIIPAKVGAAWRHGLHLGAHCIYCCANLTLILLVIGVMDLRAMIAVTSAITAERLAHDYQRVAHAIGVAFISVGVFIFTETLVHAAWLC